MISNGGDDHLNISQQQLVSFPRDRAFAVGLRSLWKAFFQPKATEQPVQSSSDPLRWGMKSITGNFRDNNEDRAMVDDQGRFFLVADGMGGQSAGEKASEMAIDLISRKLSQQIERVKEDPVKLGSVINDAVCEANAEILALGAIDPNYHSMGTTIAMLVSGKQHLHVANVGDSRVYLLRNGELQQITQDDSLVEALRQAGTITKEEAATHRFKHVLVKYLGCKESNGGVEPQQLPYHSGDRFLLCSDGVTEGVSDDRMKALLGSSNDPQEVVESVINEALKNGSRDNITCVVVFVS